MEYKIRELVTSDIFTLSRIFGKMKIKPDLEGIKGKIKDEKIKEEAGILIIIELVKTSLENLHLAQKEISEFLADLVGITSEEFEKLPIKETINIIKQFKKVEGISDFLKTAGQ